MEDTVDIINGYIITMKKTHKNTKKKKVGFYQGPDLDPLNSVGFVPSLPENLTWKFVTCEWLKNKTTAT